MRFQGTWFRLDLENALHRPVVISVVPAGMENGPVNFVAMVKFFLTEYGPDMKAGILGVFFHKPSQKGISGITQAEKLIPDRLQAITDCLSAVNAGGVKDSHRSGR
jgi:hypothetical protein